jgi:hypothetical protein
MKRPTVDLYYKVWDTRKEQYVTDQLDRDLRFSYKAAKDYTHVLAETEQHYRIDKFVAGRFVEEVK